MTVRTNEVFGDDCANIGEFGCDDVLTQVLQEDCFAQVVLRAEGIVDTPKQQVTIYGCVCMQEAMYTKLLMI